MLLAFVVGAVVGAISITVAACWVDAIPWETCPVCGKDTYGEECRN